MIYTPLTNKAMKIAYQAHEGQVDACGIPYIFHPFHLAEQMTDEATTCAALLHDVIEDTDVTLADLSKEFPKDIVDALNLLTHDKATDYFDPELIARSTREESKCYAPVMCVADKIFPSLGEYAREYLPRPEREEPAEKPETTEKLQNA